jgi:hypothetical protein
MRDETLGQPAGGILLQEVLDHAQYSLKRTKFNKPLYYKMEMGHVNQYVVAPKFGNPANETVLHRPSYNLVVCFSEIPIFVAYYELDKRFSLEVCEEERERIEDYLANEILGILVSNGIASYIVQTSKGNLYSLIRKESDDKKFLSLN